MQNQNSHVAKSQALIAQVNSETPKKPNFQEANAPANPSNLESSKGVALTSSTSHVFEGKKPTFLKNL
jgi:hypothetical protein